MKITTCKQPYVECGFLKGSEVGVLQPEIVDFIEQGMIFPCHMELKKVTGSENTGVELYKATQDELRVCRGYVEAMYKSGVEFEIGVWGILYSQVMNDLHEDVMTIDEALEYHERN